MKFQSDLIRSPTRVQPINPKNKKISMLKVHKNDNFFAFNFEICTFS